MTFGRLTTKWRIFRCDLPSENGTEVNCKIIRVAAKLHNYVINADCLNFCAVDDNDFESLEVGPLEDGPEGNRGYLCIPFEIIKPVELDCNNEDRRTMVRDILDEYTLTRPDRNTNRNK